MHLNRYALRTIRQRSGLTVSGLARRAGISQPHLSNVERGRRQASPELIVRLAAALRVPLVALLAQVEALGERTANARHLHNLGPASLLSLWPVPLGHSV